MANSNVLYYEPNFTFTAPDPNGTDMFNVVQIAPPMEDYCVVVDLEVEVPIRPLYGVVKKSDKVIHIQYSSSLNGKGKLSFNQGRRYDGSDKYYLTTEPYELGTFSDIKRDGENTAEMFGINSITIEYQTYMVPVVTVQFTDIRGLSLFGAEDLRHNVTSEGGIEYTANDAISGSFFKCFFTFPYPKFRITVKGFYGNPVSYELVCSDFRANFDSSTGNFGATAKFVGYTFSVLNDLTMTSLLASPRSEYFGKQYWENNYHRFVFEDGRPMMPLLDMIDNVNELKKNINRFDSNDEINDLQASLNKITAVKAANDNYFTHLSSVIAEQGAKEGKYIVGTKYRAAAPFNLGGDTKVLTTYYNALKTAINAANSNSFSLPMPLAFGEAKKPINELKDAEYYGNNDKDIIDYFNGLETFYGYDASELYERVTMLEYNLTRKIEVRQNEINEERNDKIENAIGFKPSVKNVTELLLAHVETFIHELYECANNVNNLPKEADFSYRKDTNVTDGFYAFPTVTKQVTENGISKVERSWVGEYDLTAPEAQLVDKLLQATTSAEATITTYRDTPTSFETASNLDINVAVPIVTCDFLGNTNPFNDIDFSTNYDLCGRLLIRALLIDNSIASFKGNSSANSQTMNELGLADAVNFYKENSEITQEFRTQISAGGTFTTDEVIKLLKGEDSALKGSGNAIWNTKTLDRNELIYEYGKNALKTVFFSFERMQGTFLPLANFNWDEFSTILSTENDRTAEYFLKNPSYYTFGLNKRSQNIFKIEKDWEKYVKYASFRQTNNSQIIESLYNFNINYDEFASYYKGILENASIVGQKWLDTDMVSKSEEYPTLIPLDVNMPLSDDEKMLFDSNTSDIKIKSYGSDKREKTLLTLTESDLSAIFSNGFNFNDYTLNYFCGYKNGLLSNEISIFGQVEYYYTYNSGEDGVEKAALMFLNTFKWDYNVLDGLLKDRNINYIPYLLAVTVGGYLKLFNNRMNKYEKFDKLFYGNDFMGYEVMTNTNVCSTLDLRKKNYFGGWINKICDELKEEFMYLFDEWVNNDFKTIHNELAIHLKNDDTFSDVPSFISDLTSRYYAKYKNFMHPSDIQEYLRKMLHDNFFKNYCMAEVSVLTYQKGLKLIHRESSDIIRNVTKKLFSPCVLFCGLKDAMIDQRIKDTDMTMITESMLKSYLNGFINGLKNNMPNDTSKSNNTPDERPFEALSSVKVQLYNYLKNIWDRWISGNPKDKGIWDLDMLRERWHYLDAFYNKLNDNAIINIFDLVDDITNSYSVIGASALSVMSSTYARSRFSLMCVQNFANLIDDELMRDIFKPIPYEKIDLTKIKNVPDFIVMYINEPSSKLDMDGSAYNNDSFLIGGDDMQLPIAIKTKTQLGGHRIPAFGVTYGSQYQSYFTDIQVGMENPQVTDQSLQAQFEIIRKTDTNDVRQVGQDLFTIYSNQSFTCTVKMMGCAWIQPLMYFQLNNIPMFKGSYLIQKVTHNISQGQMETVFVGTRISRFSTPFVDNGLVFNPNNQNGAYNIGQETEYTAASSDNTCKYKFFTPSVDNNENVGYPARDALGLFNALKKTIEYTQNSKAKDVSYESQPIARSNDDNIIRIKSSIDGGLEEIFDILLTTYYDYFSELHWVVPKNSTDKSRFVQVKASSSFDKTVASSVQNNNNISGVEVLNQYEGLDESFYKSLVKRYGKNIDNPTIFKMECKNFLQLTSSETNEWVDTVRKILNVSVSKCYDVIKEAESVDSNYEVESVTSSESNARFSWKGSKLSKNNNVEIKSPDGDYSPSGAASYVFSHLNPSDKGKCALYVREAIVNGGGMKLKTHPTSACRYVEHLPYWGFKVVYAGVSGTEPKNYDPTDGDIAVIAGLANAADRYTHGHIHIYSNGFWCSNYKTKNIWCYGSPNGRPYKVFRYFG